MEASAAPLHASRMCVGEELIRARTEVEGTVLDFLNCSLVSLGLRENCRW